MAIDYLTIPTVSTKLECAFSRGCITVSRFQHSLLDESVRASMVLGSWAHIPSLVPEKAILKRFRKRKSGEDDSDSEGDELNVSETESEDGEEDGDNAIYIPSDTDIAGPASSVTEDDEDKDVELLD
ncbi:hypothetical protein C8Q76DRAFT_633344 [Earliella scabrosa]|nr:hypothetical protein C8Q76DRAFT_633344 [Earliella scabrosa]